MALLFCDSFDHYASATMAGKWSQGTIVTGADGVNIATGRFGSGFNVTMSNVTPGASTYAGRQIDGMSATTVIAGFAYFWVTQTTHDTIIFALREGTTNHLEIRRNSAQQLYVSRNGTQIAIGSAALSPSVWHYVELKAIINSSTGLAQLRINGVQVATFSGNTRNGGSGVVNAVMIGPGPSTSIPGTLNYTLDDLYICDDTGAAPNNTFLGDIRVEALFPNGNGNSSQWVGSDADSTDNYLLVDETPASTADYVGSSTVGDKDTYNYTSITPLVGTIHGAQIIPYAAKTDAGTRTIVNVARSGSSESDSSSRTLTTTALYYPTISELNPATGLAWTVTEINAAEFGTKVNT